MPTLPRVHSALWIFPLLVFVLVLVEYGVVNSAAFTTNIDVLALVVTFDLVFGIPILGYITLVRSRRAPAKILAFFLLGGVLLAHLILPPNAKHYLAIIEWIVPIVEIALFLYALSRIRPLVAAYREARATAVYPTDALESALRYVLGTSPLISVVVIELSLLYYAVGGWFRRYTPTIASHRPFTYHLKSGYGLTAAMMIGISAIELPLVHLVVDLFSPIAAWVISGLTVYTILWLMGDYQATKLHPLVLTESDLHLQAGIRWRVTVARENIQELRPITRAERQKKEVLDLSVAGNPKLLLLLNAPVTVHGLFGMKRTTDKIALQVDDERSFIEALTPTTTA